LLAPGLGGAFPWRSYLVLYHPKTFHPRAPEEESTPENRPTIWYHKTCDSAPYIGGNVPRFHRYGAALRYWGLCCGVQQNALPNSKHHFFVVAPDRRNLHHPSLSERRWIKRYFKFSR